MILCIQDILTPEELSSAREIVAGVEFVDGAATAKDQALLVKKNEQSKKSGEVERASNIVGTAILRNKLFQLAVAPKIIVQIMFNRYSEGMSYGQHADAPLMWSSRSDVSFTVFLNDPADYDGGELLIEQPHGNQAIKLEAGQMVAYPSTTLHQVTEVTRGVRLCSVGWIRSFIRDAASREILFDIEKVRIDLFERKGPGREVDLLGKSYSNLMRRWAED